MDLSALKMDETRPIDAVILEMKRQLNQRMDRMEAKLDLLMNAIKKK